MYPTQDVPLLKRTGRVASSLLSLTSLLLNTAFVRYSLIASSALIGVTAQIEQAQAVVPTSWTFNGTGVGTLGSTSTVATTTLPNGTIVTATITGMTWYNSAPEVFTGAGLSSFPPSAPNQALGILVPAGCSTINPCGTITLAFSKPVSTAKFHVSDLGGNTSFNGKITGFRFAPVSITSGQTFSAIGQGSNTQLANGNTTITLITANNLTKVVDANSCGTQFGCGSYSIVGTEPYSSLSLQIDPLQKFGVAVAADVVLLTLDVVESVQISGTVFDDADGSKIKSVTEAGTNSGGLNAVLVDSANKVVATATVAANGTYSFSNILANAAYKVLITTNSATVGSAPPVIALPSNWVSTGENLNGTADATIDSQLNLNVTTSNVSNVNFGIEQHPTAVGGIASSQVNPGALTTVPTTVFTGSTDPDGTVASYKITAVPSNASSIEINGTSYTPANFPGSGVTVTTAQLSTIKVLPNVGTVTVGISFQAIDNAGQTSSNTATANLPFTAAPVTLSGTIFDDGDSSKIQNGTEAGTNGGGLNAVLVDSANKVIASSTVAANGTYSFSNVPASAAYTVLITTNTATVGSAPPVIALPSNWVSTGENLSAAIDGIVDSQLSVPVAISNITGANFGIEQLPNTTNISAVSQTNPGSITTVQVATLAGTDPEDGALGTGKHFKILTLPTNGTLYYSGTQITAAGFDIASYDPTLLRVDPNDGAITISFTYAAVDAANQIDPTPATVSMPFVLAAAVPDLTLAKSHTGSFTVGSTGTYIMTVGNSGTAATSGTITFIDTLPIGLTINSGAAGTVTAGGADGSSWSCSSNAVNPQTITCTSSTAIAASGTSVFSFSVAVGLGTTVGTNSITNTASVSGGAQTNTANDSSSDPTTVLSPNLTISKTHPGNFTQGGTGSYGFTVGNSGTAATSGTITVIDTLPTGLSVAAGAVTLTGTDAANWSCNAAGQSITCTSSTAIAVSGSSAFGFNVAVAINAPASVTNSVAVSGGNEATANNGNNSATDPTTVAITAAAGTDYGDAPDTYKTLLTSGGPSHSISSLYLGASVTADTDGQPNATATGDSGDDGITFSPNFGANYSTLIQAGISNQITVVSSGAGVVNAWVDYNNNGVFDAGEQILTNQAVVAGTNTLNFNVPNTALHGATFARFRLSPTSVSSPSPTGLITGGEVEDYQVNIAAPIPDGAACSTTGLLNGSFEAPVQRANSYLIQSEDNVPGWNTTATDKQIEIWSTGFLGVPSYSGNQFAEMNANQVAALYQDIATVPGSTITYQFAHRARSTSGAVVVDTAGVQAGSPGALVNLTNFKTDSTDWIFYRGTYVVPAGQYITRFQFDSISSGSGSPTVGNFLDAVQFSTNTCVTPISPPTIDLNGAATGTNYQNTFNIGGSAVAVAGADTTITDDKTNITRAIFTLTTTPDGANESLTIDPTAGGTVTGVSIDFAYNSTVGTSTTGRLTLKGSATLADYQKVIATLKYNNTKASPTLGDRIINVQVIDSDKAISNTAVSTIKVSSSSPNVLLVKRITAVNGSATNSSVALGTYNPETDTNNPSYAYDKNVIQAGLTPPSSTNWPNTTGATSSTFLLGARDGGTTKAGDEIEYTIYFLSAGTGIAKNVTICDRIPAYQTFVPDGYNGLIQAPGGDLSDRGIAVSYGGSYWSYTNLIDGDTAQYYNPGSILPPVCGAAVNVTGAVVVNLGTGATNALGGTVPNATAPGVPASSYGFVHFKAKTN